MSCKRCGACCRNSIIEIHHLDVVREPRLLEIATLMDADIPFESEWEKEYSLPSPCVFLVDNKCTIYPTRPNVCVAFDPDGNEKDKCELHRTGRMSLRLAGTEAEEWQR